MGTEAAKVRANRYIERTTRLLRTGDPDRQAAENAELSGQSRIGEDHGSTETAGRSFAGALASLGSRTRRVIDGRGGGGEAIEVLEGICFWTAIVVPVVYVPLLASGINTRSEALLLAGLLGINAVSLLGGHSYGE